MIVGMERNTGSYELQGGIGPAAYQASFEMTGAWSIPLTATCPHPRKSSSDPTFTPRRVGSICNVSKSTVQRYLERPNGLYRPSG